MVTDDIVTMHFGHLSLSRIIYRCDLQRDSGLIIPLGAMAELSFGPVRVLGLIARKNLDRQDLSQVGRMLRDKLAAPFEFLKSDFDWAWQKIEFERIEAGRVLSLLSSRYSESVFFTPPSEERIRTTAEFALAELRRRRDEEFYLMLADLMGEPTIPPSKDISELAA
jgi:hypothetical protein